MRIYLSGGSPIAEVTLKNPDIMLSKFVDAPKGKPNARMRTILEIRKKAKRVKSKKGKGI